MWGCNLNFTQKFQKSMNALVLTKMNTLQLNLLNSIDTHAYITHTVKSAS